MEPQSLPFSGASRISRACSKAGASFALPRAGSQAGRVLTELQVQPLTMHELVQRTGLPLATICARLGYLRQQRLVEAHAAKTNPQTGIPNTQYLAV